ncbi:MAG: GNAT family N-acetyltransferase [Phascolarctobacterium sp.]
MDIRKARPSEAEICYSFINDARAYHAKLGFVQWHEGYPVLRTIMDDINTGIGYALVNKSDEPVGYCCFVVGEEPAYKVIDGKWLNDATYAVVHRMAFSKNVRGKGASGEAMELLKELALSLGIKTIRVDTQAENKVMQHILEREGFVHCGYVQFDGGPKLAYQWDEE